MTPRKPWEHDAYCPGVGLDDDHEGLCSEQVGYPDSDNDYGNRRAFRLADAYFREQLNIQPPAPIRITTTGGSL